jgi:hypothetical protein
MYYVWSALYYRRYFSYRLGVRLFRFPCGGRPHPYSVGYCDYRSFIAYYQGGQCIDHTISALYKNVRDHRSRTFLFNRYRYLPLRLNLMAIDLNSLPSVTINISISWVLVSIHFIVCLKLICFPVEGSVVWPFNTSIFWAAS